MTDPYNITDLRTCKEYERLRGIIEKQVHSFNVRDAKRAKANVNLAKRLKAEQKENKELKADYNALNDTFKIEYIRADKLKAENEVLKKQVKEARQECIKEIVDKIDNRLFYNPSGNCEWGEQHLNRGSLLRYLDRLTVGKEKE